MGLEKFCLATLHRAENTNDPEKLKCIVNALNEIHANKIPLVLPLHPRTKKLLIEHGLMKSLLKSIIIIDPVGYLEMVLLEKYAKLIVTDSGGVQKEAYFHHIPCITLRNETEWVELIENGSNRLCEFSGNNLLNMICKKYDDIKVDFKLYGAGRAAELIVDKIIQHMGLKKL